MTADAKRCDCGAESHSIFSEASTHKPHLKSCASLSSPATGATARPWSVAGHDKGIIMGLRSAKPRLETVVAYTVDKGEDGSTRIANAALIVEAVNNYEAVKRERDAALQALRDCVYMIRLHGGADTLHNRQDFIAAAEIVRLDNLKNNKSWNDTTQAKKILGGER